jgi:hypothetical protein
MARPEQGEIPIEGEGVTQRKIPAIEKAARKYVEVRDERMALTKKEVDARAVLANAMHENECTIYRFGDMVVEIKPGNEKIKVKTVDEEEAEEADD